MAGGLLEYSGLVTKTKAMRARLLGADDYTAISEYESVTDFIAFLREQPAYAPVFERHREVAHRGQVEAVIRDSLYMDYCKLVRGWYNDGYLSKDPVNCTGFPVYSQEEHCSLCFHAMRSM